MVAERVRILTPEVAAAKFLTGAPGYDIAILAGQSNMSGRGTPYSTATDPVNARVFQYKSKAPNANTIVAAAEPLDMHDTPSGIGPGLQFARWYASRRLASNRKLLLVPVAHGGTPLVSTAVPLSWRRGVAGNLYANMIAQATGALASAGDGARIVGLLWVQGETDGDNSVTSLNYQTDFDALITGVRTDLGISDLPFIVGTMVPEYLGTGTRAQINAVHRSVALRFAQTDVAIGPAASNLGDGNHYNASGQRVLGKQMWEAFERVTEGLAAYSEQWVPDQVTGVAVSSASSTSLRVTWSAANAATAYLIEYRVTGSGGAWTGAGTVTTLTTLVTGLTTGTGYDVRVTAANLGASGAASATMTGTPHAPATIFADTFNRADAATLGSTDTGSKPWQLLGTSAAAAIASNKAKLTAGSTPFAYVDAGVSDGVYQITISSIGADTNLGILFRLADVNNFLSLQRVGTSDAHYVLKKKVAGTTSTIATATTAVITSGDVVAVTLNGTSISASVNGTTVITAVVTDLASATGFGFYTVTDYTKTWDDVSLVSL